MPNNDKRPVNALISFCCRGNGLIGVSDFAELVLSGSSWYVPMDVAFESLESHLFPIKRTGLVLIFLMCGLQLYPKWSQLLNCQIQMFEGFYVFA